MELAQGALVDRTSAAPGAQARALARWSFWGTLGDLAAPALLAGLGAIALGHRAALLLVAAICLAFAALVARALRGEAPPAPREDGTGETLRAALAEALRAPGLLLWAFASTLCSLLDETLVAFGASYMHHALGASASVRGIAFAAWTAGSLVGLALAERVLARAPPLRVLALSGGACAAAYVAWLLVPSPLAAIAGLFAVGLTASVHYPIAKAQAYASAPGRSALVNAVTSALLPLEVGAPIALGALADRAGPRAALLALLAQPLGLVAIAWFASRPSRGEASEGVRKR